jgi:non-ribosomal peptide synthetase component E (peptide arylation enzyme)
MGRVRFPIEGVAYHSATETDAYRRSGSWIWSTFGDMLRAAALDSPNVTYIATDEGSLTFAEADALSESLAASLFEIGLKPGDRAIFSVRHDQGSCYRSVWLLQGIGHALVVARGPVEQGGVRFH